MNFFCRKHFLCVHQRLHFIKEHGNCYEASQKFPISLPNRKCLQKWNCNSDKTFLLFNEKLKLFKEN